MSLCTSSNIAGASSQVREISSKKLHLIEIAGSLGKVERGSYHQPLNRKHPKAIKMISATLGSTRGVKAGRSSHKHSLANGTFSILVILVCFFIIANIRCDQVGSSNGKSSNYLRDY